MPAKPRAKKRLPPDDDFFFGTACTTCAHYRGMLRCAAFQERIPDKILNGSDQHRKPVKGDGGIVYKPIPRREDA